jgi:hypothetical protein
MMHVMARICSICSNPAKSQQAAEMLAAGATDQAIADKLGGMSRMAVARHRQNHVIKPAQDRLALISKGAGPRQERQQLAEAAAADAPSPQAFADAFLGLKAQAEKLAAIEARLERMQTVAEAGKSANAVAQLSAQQLRAVEVGSKLSGAGGYAPTKPAEAGGGTVFAVNFIFSNGRREGFEGLVGLTQDAPMLVGEFADQTGSGLSE